MVPGTRDLMRYEVAACSDGPSARQASLATQSEVGKMLSLRGTTIQGLHYLPEVGKMRRRLLLRFPLRLLLYTCGLGHMGSATSSPHMAEPLRVSPWEIPRA